MLFSLFCFLFHFQLWNARAGGRTRVNWSLQKYFEKQNCGSQLYCHYTTHAYIIHIEKVVLKFYYSAPGRTWTYDPFLTPKRLGGKCSNPNWATGAMRKKGFEPSQALSYWSLNPARLTTPALPRGFRTNFPYKKVYKY